MWLLTPLILATAALAVDYQGQDYTITFIRPNAASPWDLTGNHSISIQTTQTLVCCPPLPVIRFALYNSNPSLLPQQEPLVLGDSPADSITAPQNPDISGVSAGPGFTIVAYLATNDGVVFGTSETFSILDTARALSGTATLLPITDVPASAKATNANATGVAPVTGSTTTIAVNTKSASKAPSSVAAHSTTVGGKASSASAAPPAASSTKRSGAAGGAGVGVTAMVLGLVGALAV